MIKINKKFYIEQIESNDVSNLVCESYPIVDSIFKNLKEDGFYLINCFANNFTESVIYPIEKIKFFSKNKSHKIRKCKNGLPSYYLAEHESYSNFLYEHSVFLGSVYNLFCNGSSSKFYSLNFLFRIFCRNFLVFINILFDSLNVLSFTTKKTYVFKKRCLIVRNQTQYNSIKHLVDDKTFVYDLRVNDKKISISSFIIILIKWLRLFFINSNYEYKGVKLWSSIFEMKIYALKLMIYEKQLSNISFKNSSIIIYSCELKSPQAMLERLVLKNHEFIQLQIVDQDSNFIPYPIVGNYFYCDSPKSQKIFNKKYNGNFVFKGFLKLPHNLNLADCKVDFCFFTNPVEHESNITVCKIIDSFCSVNNKNFTIKPHPRDFNKYQNMGFKKLLIIDDFNHSCYKIGISYPSSVLVDLLVSKIPFILLNHIKTYQNLPCIYVDEFYKFNYKNLNEFKVSLDNLSDISNESYRLYERIVNDKFLEKL